MLCQMELPLLKEILMSQLEALIDADIFLYEFGSCTDDEGHPLKWPLVVSRLNERMSKIVHETGCTKHSMYVTGKGNFREDVATILPYKGKRPAEKPYWHAKLKDFLLIQRNANLIEGKEADDELGERQTAATEGSTIICTLDKDIDMIPGLHYTWRPSKKHPEPLYEISPTEGAQNFFKQLLTGDPTDNIPGLFGVGDKSTLVKKVFETTDTVTMYELVRKAYRDRFGNHWRTFLEENAYLLWIRRADITLMEYLGEQGHREEYLL